MNIHNIPNFLTVSIMFRRWPFRAMLVYASKNDGDYSIRELTLTFRKYPEVAEFYLDKGKFDAQKAKQWLEKYLNELDWDTVSKVKASSSSGNSTSMSQNE